MKTVFLIISMLIVLKVNAQNAQIQPDYYFKKFERQNKISKNLAIYGGIAIGAGLMITKIPSSGGELFSPTETAGYGLASAGLFAVLAAIPYKISSAKNHSKYLKLQPAVSFYKQNTAVQPIYGAKIQVDF